MFDSREEKKLTQQVVFLRADIPERYGYKLLSGEKRTKQRDIILRICYAAEMTLDETQYALKQYEMPELYAKKPRDALSMILFALVAFQSCVAGVSNALEENGEISGSAGLFVAILMLTGGIVSVATRKSIKKGV